MWKKWLHVLLVWAVAPVALSLAALNGQAAAAAITVGTNQTTVGSTVLVELTGTNLSGLQGIQLSLQWDTNKLEYAAITSASLPFFGTAHVGTNAILDGKLGIAWDDVTGVGVALTNGIRLFSVQFVIKGGAGTTSAISIADEPTAVEVLINNTASRPNVFAGWVSIGAAVGTPPGITSQPGNLTVNVTSNAAFSVVATGSAPLAYQWVKDGVALGSATNASLVLSNVQTNQAGAYTVVITNAYGSVTSSVAALTVNRLAQTITFGALPGKRVDDTAFSITATTSSGLPVSFSSSVTSVATVSGSTVTITGIGSTTITASQAGNATYLPATSVNQLLAVGGIPPGLTTQPTNLVVNATSNATFSVTATGTALLAYQWVKDGVALGSATNASLVLSNVQTNQAGAYTVVITNAYGSVTSSVAALTVNRLAQTVTFGALPGKRVDDTAFSITATASSGLPVSFSSSVTSVATVSGSTVTITGIGSTTITASQAGNATYLPATSVNQLLAVGGIPPGLTTQPTNLVVNATSNAAFSVVATGSAPLAYQWVKDGVALGSATNASLVLSNVQTNQAGAYTVIITNAYGSITSSVAALTVNRLAQAITFGALGSKTFGNAAFTVSGSASSSLAVSFSIASGPATISGNTVALTGAGSVVVRASQAGDTAYNAATPVDHVFTVAKAGQAVTFGALGIKTFGDAPFTVSSTSSSGLSPSFSIVSGLATVSGNTVTLTGASTVVVRASQLGDVNYNAATPVDQSFTVAKANQTLMFGALGNKTFGDAPFTVSATASSFLPPTFSIVSGLATVSGNTVTLTGAGTVTVRAAQAGNANYNAATSQDQSFTVNATPPSAPVITSAATATATVGQAFSYTIAANNSPTNFNATGLPAGLSVNTVTGLISGTPTAAGTSTVALSASNAGGTGSKTLTLTVNTASAVAPAGTAMLNFATYNGTASNPIFAADGLTKVAGDAGYVAQIYAGMTGDESSFGTYAPPAVFMSGAGAGFVNGPQQTGFPGGGGQILYVQIRAWRTNSGAIYELAAASGGPVGKSSVFTVTAGGTPAGGGLILFPPNVDGFASFALAVPASIPAITSSATASATVGQAFSYTITANNSPTAFNATGLPAGLSVNTGTGLISGTPTAAGTSTVTISASNTGGTGNQTLTLTVAPVITIAITTQPRDQTVVVGANVTFTVNAVGQPPLTYQWRKDGVALSGASGATLAFVPTNRAAGGAYSVVVTNAFGSVTSNPALLRVMVTQRMERPELTGGAFKLRFGDVDGAGLTEADKNGFTLQWSTNLVQWFDLTNATRSVVGGKVELEDADAVGKARKFYRVLER